MTADQAGELAAQTCARVQPNQKLSEYCWIARRVVAVVGRPKAVIEVGTEHGGTLALWAALAEPGATLVAVDSDAVANATRIRKAVGEAWDELDVQVVAGNSHEPTTAQTAHEAVGQAVDLLFIDGDHSYAGVRGDLLDYGPAVRVGGLIAFHDVNRHGTELPDYAFIEVWQLWNQLRRLFPNETDEVVHDPAQVCMGIGALRVTNEVARWLRDPQREWPR